MADSIVDIGAARAQYLAKYAPRIINVAEVERFLTSLIGERLGLTVDVIIFRGNIPAGKDGFCVKVHGESTDEAGFKLYSVLFYGKSTDRDALVQTFSDWEAHLSSYSRCGAPAATETVKLRRLCPGAISYATIADGGRLKNEGAMHFQVWA